MLDMQKEEYDKEALGKQVDCFRIGAIVATNATSTAEYIATGDKVQAKADLQGMKDVLDESCIGKPFCDKLKQNIDIAITALDKDDNDGALGAVSEIIAISVKNK